MDLIKSPSLAGRLSHYTQNWEHITIGPASHKRIFSGAYSNSTSSETSSGNKLLNRGACQNNTRGLRPPDKGGYCRSPGIHGKLRLPTVPGGEKGGGGGGQRPVINLKGLNSFIEAEHFKMEGLHLLPDLIQPQDWMVELDLKDAYLQVPIHQDSQCMLQFQWEQTIYQFVCLPFGLTSAPRVFTKIMKPVVGALRQLGIRLIIYLDDLLVLHQKRDHLMQLTTLVCQFLEALDLIVNLKKSQLTPTHEMEFLSFLVNSVSLHWAFPSEKLRKIRQLPLKERDGGTWRGLWERLRLQSGPYGRLHYTTEPCREW